MAKLIEPVQAATGQCPEDAPGQTPAGSDAPSLPVPLVLRMTGGARMDAAQFFELCRQNETYWFERSAAGEVIIMPPAGPPSSERNLELSGQLWLWAKQDGTGVPYESSAGFTLPNGADRAPD